MWTGGVRVIVLDEEKKMLLVKQHHEDKDIWMVPGGGIEEGEGARQAAAREVKEETGLDSTAGKFLGVVESSFLQHGEKHCEINLVYELSIENSDVAAQEDWIGFEWCPISNLDAANLLPADIRRLIPENG